jgi:hypothetical protein
VFYVVYGFATPVAFGLILLDGARSESLQTNRFTKTYGFLLTKMKSEYYWWELVISFRKLTLVTATQFSNGLHLPCALVNLFCTVAALTAQAYTLPFANDDANLAEALTLLATVLILVLGLAQQTRNAQNLTDELRIDEKTNEDDFLHAMNYMIYTLMIVFVGSAIAIVLRRLRGASYHICHLKKLREAEADGRQIPDDVRKMLHKKWLLVGASWAAIKAKEARDDPTIKICDRVQVRCNCQPYVLEIAGTDGLHIAAFRCGAGRVKKWPREPMCLTFNQIHTLASTST